MITFFGLEHMVDATHARSKAGVGWGGVGR